jgi:hypothetical protein
MPITGDLLNDLGQLGEVAGQVRGAVDALLAAAHDPDSTLTVSAGVDAVQRAVDNWASDTEELERRLQAYAREYPDDRFDAEARLGGVAMLHLSIAADVAILAPFDDELADSLAAKLETRAGLPLQADTSRKVLEDGGLLESLSKPVEESSPEDGEEALPEPNEEGLPEDGASDEPDESREIARLAVDDVVKNIVDRAGTACSRVALELGGILVQVAHPLSEALKLAPPAVADAVRRQIGRIAKLVKFLVRRANDIFNAVLGQYREVLTPVLDEVGAELTESLGARLVAKLVDADRVRSNAEERLTKARNARQRKRRIQKMKRVKTLHSRWVGPVRFVADGLPFLAPMMIGPVPTAAIAGVGLLGWTVIVTGDQLDTTRRFFPDLWCGVVRRAGGE